MQGPEPRAAADSQNNETQPHPQVLTRYVGPEGMMHLKS